MPCPYVSVLTVATGDRARLHAVARALRAQTLRPERFEWVVCLHGRDEGAQAALEAMALPFALRLVETEAPPSPGTARNACAERTCGSILLFDDDARLPSPGLLAAHVAAQEAGLCVALPAGVEGAGAWWRAWRGPGRAAAGGWWSVPGVAFRSQGGFDASLRGRREAERDLRRRLGRAGLPRRRLALEREGGGAASGGPSRRPTNLEEST